MLYATIFAICVTGASNTVALRVTAANQTEVPQWSLFEIALDLSAMYDNPFDPDETDVWAEFTPPHGKPVRVNAFLDQPFTSELANNYETVKASGTPAWKIRFASGETGRWRYQIFAKDRTGSVQTEPASFKIVKSANPGKVIRAPGSQRYFAFDDGSPFFAVGENLCWTGGRGTFDYEDWLGALGRAGGNWIRLWMSNWNCGLEWTSETKAPERTDIYHGVGRYNLAHAWKLDRILDLAEHSGIQVMVCLGTYGEFTTGGFFNEGQWAVNPYNKANGGPCANAADFWTDAAARKLYQRRLRYIAARYGWRSSVFAWEFWNEANAPAPWVAEMARFLKGTGEFSGAPADPFGHMVSTTYGKKEVWETPEIDFTMTHHYGQGDVPDSSPVIHYDARKYDIFKKPHLMAEFGIDWRKSDNPYDPQNKAVNLHNGLWSAACSGGAGGAMVWYWEGYVHPGNLYGQFTALRQFADCVPWTKGEWNRIEFDAPRVPSEPETFRDLVIAPASGWKRCEREQFTIEADKVPDPMSYPSFLFAPVKADLRIKPVFHVQFEKPGRFIVHVDTVSQLAKLIFTLDGNTASELSFSASPPTDPNAKPEYEKTDFRTEYNCYQAIFNKDYGIDVPAGAHDIQLEVTEGDWISVGNYTLTDYTSNRFVNLQCYGMTNGKTAVVWFHNANHNWKNVFEGKTIPAIEGAQTTLHGLKRGHYNVEWWDTWQGKPQQQVQSKCGKEGMELTLPTVTTDIAARVTRR